MKKGIVMIFFIISIVTLFSSIGLSHEQNNSQIWSNLTLADITILTNFPEKPTLLIYKNITVRNNRFYYDEEIQTGFFMPNETIYFKQQF